MEQTSVRPRGLRLLTRYWEITSLPSSPTRTIVGVSPSCTLCLGTDPWGLTTRGNRPLGREVSHPDSHSAGEISFGHRTRQ